jgi:hypothetical protein
VVEVWVERLEPALGEDFGWQRESDAVVQREGGGTQKQVQIAEAARIHRETRAQALLERREFVALLDERLIDNVFVTPTLWDGNVTIPQAPAEGTRYRLAIAEFEEYLIDDDRPYDAIPTKKDRRMVFLEYVDLS